MLFETRVSRLPTPGSEHRQHPGVKQDKTGILTTINSCFDEISLYIKEKKTWDRGFLIDTGTIV